MAFLLRVCKGEVKKGILGKNGRDKEKGSGIQFKLREGERESEREIERERERQRESDRNNLKE